MKRLILFLTALIIGVSATSLPQPAAAIPNWPPLLNCSDVNADGHVDILDIGWLVLKFGTVYGQDDYQLVYDVSGGGHVDIIDIGTAVQEFGDICPLIETQVAAAALATNQYADCQDAIADGYGSVGGQGVYVPNMGIHISKISNLSSDFDLEQPFGLVCAPTSPGSGIPGALLGLWFIDPTDSTCALYGVQGPCQDSEIQPIGFGLTNEDEDNLDPDGGGRQSGWHDHNGLCIWNSGEANASVFENVGQTQCEGSDGIWFSTYGWMMHLYNFLANDAGRFQKWNDNVPFP